MTIATFQNVEPDALIVGGGPAGAALAIHLARLGRTAEILEQSSAAHHKVCGDFLSREAVQYLEHLGLNLHSLGAVRIHGLRLASRECIAACALPFPAMSLTRRTLDEALLRLAAREGVRVLRGRRVESLQRTPSGWSANLAGGEIRRAPDAFLATGKHDVAGWRRPRGSHHDLIAFKMYFRLERAEQRALNGWVDLILFPGGYAGLQPTEDDQANLCLVVNRKTLRSCGKSWSALLSHLRNYSGHFAQRLAGAQPLLARPLALSSIPYGMLLSHAASGLWRLGDQAAVIPSFSGDGISIALHSAQVAAELYAGGATAADLARRLHRELGSSIRTATVISRLMVFSPVLAQLVRLQPLLLRSLALHTRIPESALPAPVHHPSPAAGIAA